MLINWDINFQNFCGEELDVGFLGYSSVVHFLHSIPFCALEKPGGVGDWLAYLKGTTPPKGMYILICRGGGVL